MSVADAYTQIRDYQDAIVQRVSAVATGAQLTEVATTLFAVMALALFVLKCTGWALRGFNLLDMVQTLVQIMITALLMSAFTSVVPAIFNATLFVGRALLAGLAGLSFESSEAASLSSALVGMLVKYGGTLSPDCRIDWNPLNVLDCIKGGVVAIVATLIMAVVLVLLCIAVMLVDIWGFWLYGIALAIGPVLLPFTLYKRLSFLFEGWLRFFFGTAVYVILAQVNLGLVAVAILTYLGSSVQAVASGAFTAPAQPPIKDVADILGMLLFCSVGIFSLLATGRFAGAIVSGAAGGGLNFDRIAQSVTRVVVSAYAITATGVSGARQGLRDGKQAKANRARPQRRGSGSPQRNRPSNNRPANRPAPSAPRTTHNPRVPGLSFGEALFAMGGGMVRAYRDATLNAAMRNPGFRRGYNFVKGTPTGAGGRRGRSDRGYQSLLDSDRRAQEDAARHGRDGE